MPKMFIIIRRKGSKKFTGVIRPRKGVGSKRLLEISRKGLKPGFEGKVVSLAQLKRLVVRQSPLASKVRSGKKRGVVRKKRTAVRKRRKK